MIILTYYMNSGQIGCQEKVPKKHFFDLIFECDCVLGIFRIDSVKVLVMFEVFEEILFFFQSFEMIFNNLLWGIKIEIFGFVLSHVNIDLEPALIISDIPIIPERVFPFLCGRSSVWSIGRGAKQCLQSLPFRICYLIGCDKQQL